MAQGGSDRDQVIDSVSIICPMSNADASIGELHKRISIAAKTVIPRIDYEIIYVDDGSTDSTADQLRELADADAHVGVVRLSRQFGESAAMSAGVERSDSDAVIVLPANLQSPPELIPEMVTRWREGFDVVVGRPSNAGFVKNATTSVSERIAGGRLNGMTLLDSRVVQALGVLPPARRFGTSSIAWVGFRRFDVGFEATTGLAPSEYKSRNSFGGFSDAIRRNASLRFRVSQAVVVVSGVATVLMLAAGVAASWLPLAFAVVVNQLMQLGEARDKDPMAAVVVADQVNVEEGIVDLKRQTLALPQPK
jgi:glycosyltransferase involved in cell wall biosynthesis